MMANNSSEIKSDFREKVTSINRVELDEEEGMPNEEQMQAAGIIGASN